MAKIIIRSPWSETDRGRVSNLERPSTFLRFTPDQLAPGVDMALLTSGTEVRYDLIEEGGQSVVRNLRPIGESAAKPPDNEDRTADAREPGQAAEPAPPGPDASNFIRTRPLGEWKGKAPYTFVSVVTDGETALGPVEDIVLHDGRAGSQRIGGELHVELTALSPLLVGQHRYRWDQLHTADGKRAIPGHYKRKKMILEPGMIELEDKGASVVQPARTLDDKEWRNRRVLIPATSIKGPIRQAIGAFMNAPMERVTERLYSYRPNVDATNDDRAPLRYFPAVVEKEYDDGSLCVRLVEGHNSVRFVESPVAEYCFIKADKEVADEIFQRLTPGTELAPASMRHYRIDNNRFLFDNDSPCNNSSGYRIFEYATGIDGKALLAQNAKNNHEEGQPPRFKHHFRALVLDQHLGEEITIEPRVVKQYKRTLEMLADKNRGHLSRLPGKDKIDDLDGLAVQIRSNNRPRTHQLIYVEVRMDKRGKPDEIVSFGTHFRYRWAYKDSIREIMIDPETGDTKTRAELRPASEERITSDADGSFRDGKLTGARLLFGYAADKASATDRIGDKGFSRLAGRIAINHAIEVVDPQGATAEARFLYLDDIEGDARFLLPLRILGAPKPSAVEHYVPQHDVGDIRGATVTYGDLVEPDSKGGDLNGRKFYRHQPSDIPDGPLTGHETFLAESRDICLSDQATLARLVSRPGTRFRCSVRFRDLRKWELGALLLAMQPDLIAAVPRDKIDDQVRKVIEKAESARTDAAHPLFALKMGYARPLGFGSARLTVKRARLLTNTPALIDETDLATWQGDAVVAFVEQMHKARLNLTEWLQAAQYAGCTRADYPRAEDGKVYSHHTKIRKQHAEQRRQYEIGADEQYDKHVWLGTERGERGAKTSTQS